MTGAALRVAALLLSLASSSLARDASTATPPASRMVFLPRTELRLGSTNDELVRAAELCNRDAGEEICSPETFANEARGPKVIVDDFWLDRHEVSYRDFTRCVEAGRCRQPIYAGAERLQQDELPVVFVSQVDAANFCAFRDSRLPTEAELERASRGAQRRTFPWGERFNGTVANHGRSGVLNTSERDGADELAPVDAFTAGQSPEGALNLAGNVAEWTNTEYAAYDDPDAARGEVAVRGGHYLIGPAWLRGAARLHEPKNRRAPYLGFRCAKDAHPRTSNTPTSPLP